jgi:hypothetical protein
VNIQPYSSVSPSPEGTHPLDTTRETAVGQAILNTAMSNEGPSQLAARDITPAGSGSGTAALTADLALDMLAGSQFGQMDDVFEGLPDELFGPTEFYDPARAVRDEHQQFFRQCLESLVIEGPADLADAAECRPSLKRLILSNSRGIPDWVRHCSNLETLYIQFDEACHMPEWLGDLTQLKNLRLRGPLLSVPRSIGRLQDLKMLAFEGAAFETLPEELMNCQTLSSLSISMNRSLIELPQRLFELPLTNFSCTSCDNLGALPDGLENCQTLIEINCFGLGRLQAAPEMRSSLRNLERVTWQHSLLRIPVAMIPWLTIERLWVDRGDLEQLTEGDVLFDGLSEKEKTQLIESHQRLLEALRQSDVNDEFTEGGDPDDESSNLLRTIDLPGGSDGAPAVGLRSRFARLLWNCIVKERKEMIELELTELQNQHRLVEKAVNSNPENQELRFLEQALRTAVIPDAQLRVRRANRQLPPQQ